MEFLEFTSTINCNNCLSKVKPQLEKITGVKNFEVDFSHPERILKVEGINLSVESISEAIESVGFEAQIKTKITK